MSLDRLLVSQADDKSDDDKMQDSITQSRRAPLRNLSASEFQMQFVTCNPGQAPITSTGMDCRELELHQ